MMTILYVVLLMRYPDIYILFLLPISSRSNEKAVTNRNNAKMSNNTKMIIKSKIVLKLKINSQFDNNHSLKKINLLSPSSCTTQTFTLTISELFEETNRSKY